MSKQDRQGVRTPADVERKYNLGRLAAAQGSPGKQDEQIQQLSQTLAQFMADTNGKFQELEGHTQTFFYSGVPTLDNAPAVEWETNEAKAEHIGDLYYNEDDGSLYLFKGDGTSFEWLQCSGGGDLENAVLKSELLQEIDFSNNPNQVYSVDAVNRVLASFSEIVTGLEESKVAKTDIATEIAFDWDANMIYNVKAINEAFMVFAERLEALESESDGVNARVTLAKNIDFEANVQPTATIEEIEG